MDRSMRRHALWIAKAMARTDLTPLRESDIEALTALCRERHVEPGEVLLRMGEPVSTIFVVRSGEIHLALRGQLGARQTVQRIRSGGVVGDLPMLCEQPMPLDALAGEHSTLLELPHDGLVAVLQRSPTLSLRWMTSLAKRFEETQRRLITVLTADLDAQLASMLLDERERDAEHGWVVRLSHGVLAGMLGARRQSVSRVIARFRRSGLVTSGYRRIVLHDLGTLAAIAGEVPPASDEPFAAPDA